MIYFIKFSALDLSIRFAGISSFSYDPNNEGELNSCLAVIRYLCPRGD